MTRLVPLCLFGYLVAVPVVGAVWLLGPALAAIVIGVLLVGYVPFRRHMARKFEDALSWPVSELHPDKDAA